MIETAIKNQDLRFHTSSEVFSPSSIDKGTLAMLSVVAIESTDKLLDLGCGYGVVGITASKLIGTENVVMCDVSDEALKLSRMNAELNGVSKVKIVKSFGLNSIEDRDFTLILSRTEILHLYYRIRHTIRIFLLPKTLLKRDFKSWRMVASLLWSPSVESGTRIS